MALGFVAAVGAAGVYWVAKNPPSFNDVHRNLPKSVPATPDQFRAAVGPASLEEGFLVLRLRAAAELTDAAATPAFEGTIENRGFATACDGKVVTLNMRSQDHGKGGSEEGAVAEVDTVVCLPALKEVKGEAVAADGMPEVAPQMEDEAKQVYEQASLGGAARARVIDTGRGQYQVFIGAVSFAGCAAPCASGKAWGTTAQVGVVKVMRPLDNENYLFSVPAGSGSTVSLNMAVPVER